MLKDVCFERCQMDEDSFQAAISNLIDIGCIKQLTRLGKVSYSLLQDKVPNPILPTENCLLISLTLKYMSRNHCVL